MYGGLRKSIYLSQSVKTGIRVQGMENKRVSCSHFPPAEIFKYAMLGFLKSAPLMMLVFLTR